MQGKKHQQEKLFISFQLSDYVPADNFYRRLKGILDLNFLYRDTAEYYGQEGQKSIDPVVFMKLMLVGYLENINSDRRIVGMARMRMDILYFLGYNLDEDFPWHSTLSRTRRLYGETLFVGLFKKVLKLCIDAGLVNGKRQAVDSALIQANASKDYMLERRVLDDVFTYSKELETNSEEPLADKPWKEKNKPRDKDGEKKISNATHYNPSDPDARLTKKPGKPLDLYYRSQVSVDTESHFITHIQAFPGNAADNISLPQVLEHITETMRDNHIHLKEILADTGYSSGESLQALLDKDMLGYIPNPVNYKNSRQGFIYDAENDWYVCSNGAKLTFRGITSSAKKQTIQKRIYQSSSSDCRSCPFRADCAGKSGVKRLTDSLDKPLYDQMHRLMQTTKAKNMSRLRSATVEPVLGSLINYTGMKRINAKGLSQANKCMNLAATAYNLKKLIKYSFKKVKTGAGALLKATTGGFDALLPNISVSYAFNCNYSFNQYFKQRYLLISRLALFKLNLH
jgi:transposase